MHISELGPITEYIPGEQTAIHLIKLLILLNNQLSI